MVYYPNNSPYGVIENNPRSNSQRQNMSALGVVEETTYRSRTYILIVDRDRVPLQLFSESVRDHTTTLKICNEKNLLELLVRKQSNMGDVRRMHPQARNPYESSSTSIHQLGVVEEYNPHAHQYRLITSGHEVVDVQEVQTPNSDEVRLKLTPENENKLLAALQIAQRIAQPVIAPSANPHNMSDVLSYGRAHPQSRNPYNN